MSDLAPAPGVPPVLGRPSAATAAPVPLRDSDEGAVADYRAGGGEAGPWSLRVASVTGVRHRLAAVGSDDAYGWSRTTGGLIAAVADGLGSVEGSASAAAAAVAAVRTANPDAAPGAAACAAVVAAANEAVAGSGGATTLVVAVAEPDGSCRLARVGDSTALLLCAGRWRDVFDDGDGNDALVATSTAALPATEPAVEYAEVALGEGSVLVLVTDGVAGPLRDGPTTVAPAFADLLGQPPTPLALASLLDFSRHGCHDDRTLLGLWWAPSDRRSEGGAEG